VSSSALCTECQILSDEENCFLKSGSRTSAGSNLIFSAFCAKDLPRYLSLSLAGRDVKAIAICHAECSHYFDCLTRS
jgi:hypothetical protein